VEEQSKRNPIAWICSHEKVNLFYNEASFNDNRLILLSIYAWIKPLDRKIGGLHSHAGCCTEERKPNSPLETKPCPYEQESTITATVICRV
jgi:hypothetical protein